MSRVICYLLVIQTTIAKLSFAVDRLVVKINKIILVLFIINIKTKLTVSSMCKADIGYNISQN